MDDDEEKKNRADWLRRKNDPNLTFTEVLAAGDIPVDIQEQAYENAAPGHAEVAKLAAMTVALGLKAIIGLFRKRNFHGPEASAVINSYRNLLLSVPSTISRSAVFTLAAFYGDTVRLWMMLNSIPSDNMDVHFKLQGDEPDEPVNMFYGQIVSASIANRVQDVHALLHSTDDNEMLVEAFMCILASLAEMLESGRPNAVFGQAAPFQIPDDASSLLDDEE
jgi:hypothetical protein